MNPSQRCRFPGRDSNQLSPECKSGMSLLEEICSFDIFKEDKAEDGKTRVITFIIWVLYRILLRRLNEEM
jgi:hypothetical protein